MSREHEPGTFRPTGWPGLLITICAALIFLWVFRVHAQWNAVSMAGAAAFTPENFRAELPALTRFLQWIEVDPLAPLDEAEHALRLEEVNLMLRLAFVACFAFILTGLGVFATAFRIPGAAFGLLRLTGRLLSAAGLMFAGMAVHLQISHNRTLPRQAFLDERDVLMTEYIYGDLSAMLTLPVLPGGEIVSPGDARDMHLVAGRPHILLLDNVLHTPATLREALPELVARRERLRLFLWVDQAADADEMLHSLEEAGFPLNRVRRVALDGNAQPRAHSIGRFSGSEG